MLEQANLPATGGIPGAIAVTAATRGQLFLVFALGGESFAIDISRIREILEYSPPTAVPLMPRSVRGVINVRGSVVPVIDLAVRFGWTPTAVGRRTSVVIVEIEYQGGQQVLGLMVDRVHAVTEIKADDIEPAPAFGANLDTEYIGGMARLDGRFVIVLNVARALSIEEMAEISRASGAPVAA